MEKPPDDTTPRSSILVYPPQLSMDGEATGRRYTPILDLQPRSQIHDPWYSLWATTATIWSHKSINISRLGDDHLIILIPAHNPQNIDIYLDDDVDVEALD